MIHARRSSIIVWLVTLLCAELIVIPIPSAFAATPDPQQVPTSPAFSEQQPSIATRPSPVPATAASTSVSPTGALKYSYAIEVPPGRNGAAPSLALSYSSDALDEVSPFGAGWSLPISTIRRVTRLGEPGIDKNGSTYVYKDSTANGAPRFERDGAELVVELQPCSTRACVPGPVPDPRGLVYRDTAAFDETRSIYNAAGDYWLVLEPNGTQRWYGHVANDASAAAAVIGDDLGTSQWGLVRTVDAFGNSVDYSYVASPSRANPSDPQLRLLPDAIRYGANVKTGASHFAAVSFTYKTQATPLQLDHLHGHTYLDRVIDTIKVWIISSATNQPFVVRGYTFAVGPSAKSAHWLLQSIQETAIGVTAPPTKFTYSSNSYSPVLPWLAPNASLAAAIPGPVYRNFNDDWFASTGTINWGAFNATPPWPDAWYKRLSLSQILLTPPGLPTAFRFDDLDGDGKTDILYSPNYAAGLGIVQPWVSYHNNGNGQWTSFDAAYSSDPLSTPLGSSEFVDVDRDGVVDRIKLNPNIAQDGSAASTNPAIGGLCAWWFEHQGGYTDPPPDNIAIEGVYLIDEVARNAGFSHDAGWVSTINQLFQSAVNGGLTAHMAAPLSIPIVPLDGGVPGAVGACYRPGTPGGPPINVNGDWLPIPLPGSPNANETYLGGVTIEHGRLLDPIATPPLASPLAHYPSAIGKPSFYLQFKQTKDPQGNIVSVPQNVNVRNSVFEPLVDLDGDGVPEIVALKGGGAGYSNFDAGVWRIRNLAAVHEYDDSYWTNTRFVDSLHQILMRSVPLFYPNGQSPACGSSKARTTSSSGTINQQVLAWFQTEATRYSGQVAISPPEVLGIRNVANQLLAPGGAINNWINNIAINVEIPRLIPDADWISTFMDVNGDSLPDLVLARGATCIDTSTVPATTDQRAGFDVYLNRGDRFETTPASTAYTAGPFNMVRNWSATATLDVNSLVDKSYFPFGTLAFADLNGDGVGDATLTALVNYTGPVSDNYPWDAGACVRVTTQDPLHPGPQALVRCVWRGGYNGWTADSGLAAALPTDDYNAVLMWDGARFSDKVQIFDLTRYVDVDGDGMVDVVGMRGNSKSEPTGDATRVYRNSNQTPDLLSGIDNGLGRVTSVGYLPFRPGSNVYQAPSQGGRVPGARWVVSSIAESTMNGSGDWEFGSTSSYTYQDGKYDFANREFLGFRKVTEFRLASFERKEISWLQIDREYYQDEQSSIYAANPLKGVLAAETSRAADVETQRTAHQYDVVSRPSGVSVVATGTKSITCSGTGCETQPGANGITVTHQLANFENLYYPLSEVVTAVRQLGDGLDQTITYNVARTYQYDTDNWILGLKASEVHSDANGVISSESYTYNLNKLATRTVKRYGIATGCNDSGIDFQQRTDYTAEGLAQDFYDNNQQIVGGAAPHRHLDYDAFYRVYPVVTTDYYTNNGRAATLTQSAQYDPRFGSVAAATDANGRTRTTLRDGLGRVTDEYNEDNALVRHTDYDLTTKPPRATTTQYPGAGQPNIVTVAYYDGAGRLRQQSLATATGAVVQVWRTFDSLGLESASALPTEAATMAFIPYSSSNATTMHASKSYHDSRGRVVDQVLPDGRESTTQYAVGKTTSTDARQTPRDVYTDALGRVIAVDEYYLSSVDTAQTFAKYRTSLVRDTAGDVLQTTNADGHVRRFTYNQAGQVVTAEAPHSVNGAIDTYTMCYDGLGRATRTSTPEGRSVSQYRDELGRVIVRTAAPSGDTTTYSYDDATVPNGLGRLASVANDHATEKTVAYDTRGNALQRTFQTTLGAAAAPWSDGTYTTTATYDALNRPLTQGLPYDANLVSTAETAQLTYNERGLPKSLTVGGTRWLGIDDYAPDSRPRAISYGNGLSEQRVYDATTARLTSTTLSRAGSTIDSYSFGYDADDNPSEVDRNFVDASGAAGRRNRTFGFDSFNRVESERVWLGPPLRPFTSYYRYSPAGNITSKNFRDYAYQGRDPQAVTSRISNGTTVEQYQYDRDGWMIAATPDANGTDWQYGYDGEGHLVSASSDTPGAPLLSFTYGPDGKRIAKRQSCTTGSCASWSDLYIDELELRGSESAATGVPAYYNLSLGAVRAQLALRRSTAGKLERDAQADRWYFLDYLGSTAMVTASDGTAANVHGDAGRFDYDAYGTSTPMYDASPNIKERYNGKELDETGLSYYGARYASNPLGRWAGRDPLALVNPETAFKSSQRANLYSFDDNNPVKLVDRDGRIPVVWFIEGVIELAEVLLGATALTSAAEQHDMRLPRPDARIFKFPGTELWSKLGPLHHDATEHPEHTNAAAGAESKAATDAKEKSVPNPYGTKGSPAHQEKIDERIKKLKEEGYEHVGGGSKDGKPEEVIATPAGEKGSRRVDITMKRPDGTPYREQVGVANKNGTPVSRERDAMDDIEQATGDRPTFVPYKTR